MPTYGRAMCVVFAVTTLSPLPHQLSTASGGEPTTAPATQPINPKSAGAKQAMEAGRYKEARDLFLQTANADPKDFKALHGAGVACLYLRDDRQANKLLAQAVEIAPVADRALSYNFAVSDMNLKNYRRAAETLRDYLYANPRSLDEPLANALGAQLYQTGEQNTASRASDDTRKFYSVYVSRLEEKRPGLRKWGPKWLPAREVEGRAKRMRDAETEIVLLREEAKTAEGNINRKKIDFREQQEKKARLAEAQAVVDEVRPAYPQLLLPMHIDDTTAPPFDAIVPPVTARKDELAHVPRASVPGPDPELRPGSDEAADSTDSVDAAKPIIDLMPLIDLKRDIIEGTWKMESGGLAASASHNARLKIRYSPPDEYDFAIEFTKRADGIVMQLVTHDGQGCGWDMFADLAGFEVLDGRRVGDKGNRTTKSVSIEIGKRYRSVVKVRNDSVAAYIDDELISSFKTDFRNIDFFQTHRIPKDILGLVLCGQDCVFHKIEIVEISGRGSRQR